MLFFCFISFFKCASKFASRISPKQWQKIILKLGNICNNLQKKSDIWLSAEGRFELSKTIQQKFCSHFSTIFLVKKSYFLLLMSEINDNDVWNVTFIVRLTHMVQLFGIMALIFQIQQRKWTRMMMGRFVFLIFHCVLCWVAEAEADSCDTVCTSKLLGGIASTKSSRIEFEI